MMTVFLKSTVRPWASVKRPSSRICSSVLKTSGVGLLDLVEEHDGERLAADGFGELSALVVPDVAGGRADETAHGVLVHVLGHVELDEGLLVAEEERSQALAQSPSSRRRTARGRRTNRQGAWDP